MKNGKHMIHDGFAWYQEDLLHNEDNPAIEWDDGSYAFYLNGIQLTEEEFNQWLEKKSLHEKLESNLEYKNKESRIKI